MWPGAQPWPARVAYGMHSRCQYPWCTHPEFSDGESGVKARVGDEPPGNMHVSHTELGYSYNGGVTEFYDDGIPEVIIEVHPTDDTKLEVSQPMSLNEAWALARQGLGWAVCITPEKAKYTQWVVAKIPRNG